MTIIHSHTVLLLVVIGLLLKCSITVPITNKFNFSTLSTNSSRVSEQQPLSVEKDPHSLRTTGTASTDHANEERGPYYEVWLHIQEVVNHSRGSSLKHRLGKVSEEEELAAQKLVAAVNKGKDTNAATAELASANEKFVRLKQKQLDYASAVAKKYQARAAKMTLKYKMERQRQLKAREDNYFFVALNPGVTPQRAIEIWSDEVLSAEAKKIAAIKRLDTDPVAPHVTREQAEAAIIEVRNLEIFAAFDKLLHNKKNEERRHQHFYAEIDRSHDMRQLIGEVNYAKRRAEKAMDVKAKLEAEVVAAKIRAPKMEEEADAVPHLL